VLNSTQLISSVPLVLLPEISRRCADSSISLKRRRKRNRGRSGIEKMLAH
jgi:hypothetical protein